MKVAYVTIKDAKSLGRHTEWSGTGYYIAKALEQQGVSVDYLGPLADSVPLKAVRRAKRSFYQQVQGKRYLKDTDPLMLRHLARQVHNKLRQGTYDVVLSATVNPIVYLECDLPVVFWADATFKNTANFYPEYSNLCAETLDNGHAMERRALERCAMAIYSSDWAADAALSFYQADPRKVRVLNFGANLDSHYSLAEIRQTVDARPTDRCHLLFLGKDWFRKGGHVALAVAKALNEKGLKTELTVVGCEPKDVDPLPDYVNPLGFISKFSPEGRERLSNLIASAHFLILPTIADCSPIVLAEACSLGVPCLATEVGGIPSIIKPGVNGQMFPVESAIDQYVSYVLELMKGKTSYRDLAISTFEEYRGRLNWTWSGAHLKALLAEAARPAKQTANRRGQTAPP